MKRKFVAVGVICVLLVRFVLLADAEMFLNVDAKTKVELGISYEVSERIPESATKYVKTNLANIKEAARGFAEELGIEKSDLNNISIGMPFVIYDADVVEQPEEFCYPMVNNSSGDIVLVINIIGTSVGWQHSFNTDLVDELNQVGWPQKDCIFIERQGKVEIEMLSLSSDNITGDNIHLISEDDLETKGEMIIDSMSTMKKVDVKINSQVEEKALFGSYTPTITNELGYYYCNLNNAVAQGDYNVCWAATVGTIVNYLQGSNLSAFNVCDAIGHGYSAGTTSDTKKALKHYGYNYVYRERDLYFKTVIANIQRKKPIALFGNANGQSMGHVVTIYGYRELSNGEYILIWDSAEENVNIVSYSEGGTTFASGGVAYTWTKSLSYK